MEADTGTDMLKVFRHLQPPFPKCEEFMGAVGTRGRVEELPYIHTPTWRRNVDLVYIRCHNTITFEPR